MKHNHMYDSKSVYSASKILICEIALLPAFFAVHAGRREASRVVNLTLSISQVLQLASTLPQAE